MHINDPTDPTVIVAATLHAALWKADLKLPIMVMGANIAGPKSPFHDFKITGDAFTAFLAEQTSPVPFEEPGDIAAFRNADRSANFSIDFEGDPEAFAAWVEEAVLDLSVSNVFHTAVTPAFVPKVRKLLAPVRRTA